MNPSYVVLSNFSLYPQTPVRRGTCTPKINVCGHAVFIREAQVAQWAKCWPADLAVMGLIPARGRNVFSGKLDSTTNSLSLSPSHHPDMTEILLKRTLNCKSFIYPYTINLNSK